MICYLAFAIKCQTKATAAFKGSFSIYVPILFKLCMQVAYLPPLIICLMAFKMISRCNKHQECWRYDFCEPLFAINVVKVIIGHCFATRGLVNWSLKLKSCLSITKSVVLMFWLILHIDTWIDWQIHSLLSSKIPKIPKNCTCTVKNKDGFYTGVFDQSKPVTISCWILTSGAWWNSALELRRIPLWFLISIASPTCLESGSLKVLTTLNDQSGTSSLWNSTWCLYMKLFSSFFSHFLSCSFALV